MNLFRGRHFSWNTKSIDGAENMNREKMPKKMAKNTHRTNNKSIFHIVLNPGTPEKRTSNSLVIHPTTDDRAELVHRTFIAVRWR